jgi:ElaB/YqjD/DUF883 family membrane-anchored ribosome-binding protein
MVSPATDVQERLRKTFMNKTDKLNRAVDDAMDQVADALENVKAHAISTADEIGRATRRTVHSAQGATEEAWSDAASSAKVLRSRVELYLQEQPLHTVVLALATGFLLSLVLLFFRMNRKQPSTLKQTEPPLD